ncbi:MAG: hypothetical protein AAB401_08210, partial [Acidobacteriota bacterium]
PQVPLSIAPEIAADLMANLTSAAISCFMRHQFDNDKHYFRLAFERNLRQKVKPFIHYQSYWNREHSPN